MTDFVLFFLYVPNKLEFRYNETYPTKNAHTQQVCAFFEKNKSKIYLKPILSCVLVPIIM